MKHYFIPELKERSLRTDLQTYQTCQKMFGTLAIFTWIMILKLLLFDGLNRPGYVYFITSKFGFLFGYSTRFIICFLFVFENQTYTTYSHMQITCTIKKWRALCLGNKTNLVNGGIHQCKTKCTMGLPFLQLSAANVYQRHIIHVQNTVSSKWKNAIQIKLQFMGWCTCITSDVQY